jgi:signal transduction histidine kinase
VSNLTKDIDSRYARFLKNIHSSGQYLLGIINNILDLSKIEAGKMELQPETIALRETVNGIVAVMMKGVTESKRIRIELEIPSEIPKFEADPTQLKQIIYNLMANAVKFSPENSTVTVAARHLWPVDSPIGENAVEIRVIDNGIGIDPKDHQLIFQEFRQAHGARGRPEGTGLGLTLVKRFVEMHGGVIRLESEPGEGSTFIVVLPCRHQPLVSSDGSAQADAAAKG